MSYPHSTPKLVDFANLFHFRMKLSTCSLPFQDACFVSYFNHWIPDFWKNPVNVLLNCLHVELHFFSFFFSLEEDGRAFTKVEMTFNLFVSLWVIAISLVVHRKV